MKQLGESGWVATAKFKAMQERAEKAETERDAWHATTILARSRAEKAEAELTTLRADRDFLLKDRTDVLECYNGRTSEALALTAEAATLRQRAEEAEASVAALQAQLAKWGGVIEDATQRAEEAEHGAAACRAALMIIANAGLHNVAEPGEPERLGHDPQYLARTALSSTAGRTLAERVVRLERVREAAQQRCVVHAHCRGLTCVRLEEALAALADTPRCSRCGKATDAGPCPGCAVVVCQLCAEREGDSCCGTADTPTPKETP